MGSPYYVPWVQNVAPNATPTVEAGTEDTTLAVANIANGDPSLGVRILGTQGAWGFSFASAVSVALLGLIHHSFKAGLAIRLEGGSNSDFSSPSVSFNITIPTRRVDGYGNAWLDVQAAHGSVPSYQYWQLIVDADTNDVNLAVGEVVLGTTRNTMPQWIGLDDHTLEETQDAVVHETYARLKLRHPKGFPIEKISGSVFAATGAEMQAMRDWFRRSIGMALPVLLMPDSEESDCVFGVLDVTQTRRQLVSGDPSTVGSVRFAWGFEELSRGLTWD